MFKAEFVEKNTIIKSQALDSIVKNAMETFGEECDSSFLAKMNKSYHKTVASGLRAQFDEIAQHLQEDVRLIVSRLSK